MSVFDSGFVLGDGVWEGLRVHQRPDRLSRPPPRPAVRRRQGDRDGHRARRASELTRRLYETLDANRMSDGVHIRLMVTRGVRSTPYQDPRVVVGGATIVIIAEYKEPEPSDRRARHPPVHRPRPPRRPGGPGSQAQLAFQAQLHHRLHPGDRGRRRRGADARPARLRRDLQLDPFLHRPQGEVWTSSGDYCLGGITRANVLELCRANGIPALRKEFLADRRLWRRRGLRHRHLRRGGAGARASTGAS